MEVGDKGHVRGMVEADSGQDGGVARGRMVGSRTHSKRRRSGHGGLGDGLRRWANPECKPSSAGESEGVVDCCLWCLSSIVGDDDHGRYEGTGRKSLTSHQLCKIMQ